MKKIIACLLLLVVFCVGCLTLKIPTPIETKLLHKMQIVNDTANRVVCVSITPRPLTEENRDFLYDMIVLYPQWFVEKHKSGEFSKTIFLAKGNYFVIYLIEDLETNMTVQISHTSIAVSADGEMFFRDILRGV